MSHDALLRALPMGGQIWVRAAGRSLWPLVLDGDQLLVRRCERFALRRGDIALVSWAGGAVVGHLVEQVDPLITVSSVGVRDPLGAELLGRAIAVRRGTVRFSVPRAVLHWVPRAATVLKRLPLARAAVQRLRDRGSRQTR